jgi:preprotein translocase subunit SecA
LHNLVELKEGLKPSAPTQTLAQTSYQRFFARYLFVAGTSGTLAECKRELMQVYGLQVQAVPLRSPCRRRLLPTQRFASQALRNEALVGRVLALRAGARPVLVGVATVAQAQALSAALVRAGVPHRVLDARHDRDEAQTIAAAGQAGAVTVATAMAGRGTDIALGPGVAYNGGLHVLLCQDHRCARLDRQFMGRAARQGEPGSAEVWLAADAPSAQPQAASQPQTRVPVQAAPSTDTDTPAWWLAAAHRLRQRWHQGRQMQRRRRLLLQELAWQKQFNLTHLHA